jgi:predicted RNA-binding protein YlxR (DUF448 family)/ribosomal protein L30E
MLAMARTSGARTGSKAVKPVETPVNPGGDPGEAGAESGRRCLVTGDVLPKERLIRFVVGPDARIVPDIEEKLPGRGLWLTARRDIVSAAAAKNHFARAAQTRVELEPDLADRVEALLVRRVMDLIGLARRAGQAAAGFENVRAALSARRVAIMLAASDGADDGRRKLRALAADVPVADQLTAAELGAALGRPHAVHGAVAPGALAKLILRESRRLAGFRDMCVSAPARR